MGGGVLRGVGGCERSFELKKGNLNKFDSERSENYLQML